MIAHEDPGVDSAFRFNNVLPQSLQEFAPVLIVAEDVRLIVPAHHDVMQRSGNVQARFSWHASSLFTIADD